MCGVEKGCLCLPLDIGCLVLGYINLIFSLLMDIYCIVLLALEHQRPHLGTEYLMMVTHLCLEKSSINIILSLCVIFYFLWTLFSIMLIFGIKKNRASYVLSYFSYGIVMTIVMMLGALLVLLRGHWIITLMVFFAAMLYIHYLIVVYNVYELMLRGKVFGSNRHEQLDEDQLI